MPYLKKTVLILVALLIVAGCAPVISQTTLNSVDRTIKFSDLVKDPGKHAGQSVVLGGSIIGVSISVDKTEIEILDQPLNNGLKPVAPESSEGRFIAIFEGFKDPALYYANRRITVAGVFKGIVKRRLGNMDYAYPVIKAQEHYLWKSPYAPPSVGLGVGIGIGF